ncbi:MAG: hypothetical protein O3A51_09005, partial [Verrucomicrobia bacterium]|nr:hypothetical protein [Verrucomicrobiota bacterium]
MKGLRIQVRWLLIAAILFTGCGRRESASDVIAEARETVSGGDVDAAIRRVLKAFEDPAKDSDRRDLAGVALELWITHDRLEEAKAFCQTLMATDADLAEQGILAIGRFYRSTSRHADLEQWARQVNRSELATPLRLQLFAWQLESQLAMDQADQAVAVVPALLESLVDSDIARLLAYLAQSQQNAGVGDRLVPVLSAFQVQAPDRAGVQQAVILAELELLTGQSAWDQIETKFREAMASAADADLGRSLERLTARLIEAQQWDLLASVVDAALEETTDKPMTQQVAANHWVRLGHAMRNPTAVASRLNTLLDRDFDAAFVTTLYRSQFYYLLQQEDADINAMVVQIGERLDGLLKDETVRQGLRPLLFDAAFMLEDYDRVIAFINDGMPGMDADWHAMALNKVLAHKAVKTGHLEEAIDRFRAFMANVDATWDQPQRDPSTQLLFSREMALGFHAAR